MSLRCGPTAGGCLLDTHVRDVNAASLSDSLQLAPRLASVHPSLLTGLNVVADAALGSVLR